MLLGPTDKEHPGIVPGGPPGAPHFGNWYPIKGHFFDYQSNGSTYGIAEIADAYAEEKIKSHEWEAVSPSVYGIARKTEDGGVEFDDYVFQHVLFLPKDKKPAYPGAGVKAIIPAAASAQTFAIALQAAVEEAFPSHALERGLDNEGGPSLPFNKGTQGPKKTDADGPDKKTSAIKSNGDGTMSQTPEAEKSTLDKIKEMLNIGQGGMNPVPAKDTPPKDTDLTEVVTKQAKEIEVLSAKAKILEDGLKVIEDQRQAAMIDEIIQVELRHGMVDKTGRDAEATRLKALSREALDESKRTADRAAAAISSLPVAKPLETPEAIAQAVDLKEDVREDLYGFRRNAQGMKVEEAPEKEKAKP